MIDEGTNPQEAANSSQAIFTAMTSATSLPYGPGYPGFVPLQAGKQYALRVQVVSTDAGQQFANDGKSQVVSFSYGHSCVPPVNVSMAASDNFWDKLSWTPVAGVESYRVRFTSRITGITDSTEVYGSYYDLYNPNRRDTLTYSIVSLCSAGRRSSEVTAERPTERNLRTLKNEEEKSLTQFNVNSESANPFDRLVSTSGVSDSDIERELNRIKNPYDEIDRPCNSDKVTSTDCDPATITPTAGTENFILAPQKYMYINGYEILITSPNEGLLYLPLIQSRIPVYWEGTLDIKKASPEDDYGCIMDGEVKMQGSVTGAIGRDLHRQVMALLTQGPGQWSGKLGDSFDAFEKIILEIEQTENPTPAQFSKFKNVGSIVNQALETWKESLQDRAGNAVADNMMAKIEQWASTIQAALAVATPTKATATSVKAEATAASKSYKRSNVIEKVLIAIKNGKNSASVDISTLLDDYCTTTDAVVLGAVRKVYLDGQSYLPTQIGCNTLISIAELSLSDDKTKIEGLNLRGDAADMEAIWNWLEIENSMSDLLAIDQLNTLRRAKTGETLYFVRKDHENRQIQFKWSESTLLSANQMSYEYTNSKGVITSRTPCPSGSNMSPCSVGSVTFGIDDSPINMDFSITKNGLVKRVKAQGISFYEEAHIYTPAQIKPITDKLTSLIKMSDDFIKLLTPCELEVSVGGGFKRTLNNKDDNNSNQILDVTNDEAFFSASGGVECNFMFPGIPGPILAVLPSNLKPFYLGLSLGGKYSYSKEIALRNIDKTKEIKFEPSGGLDITLSGGIKMGNNSGPDNPLGEFGILGKLGIEGGLSIEFKSGEEGCDGINAELKTSGVNAVASFGLTISVANKWGFEIGPYIYNKSFIDPKTISNACLD
jgi:hypothetical protein